MAREPAIMEPKVTVGGTACRAARVAIRALPARVPVAEVEGPMPGGRVKPGTEVEVSLPGEAAWSGKVAKVRETRTRTGVSWSLVVVPPSGRLDTEPVSRYYSQTTLSNLLSGVLTEAGMTLESKGKDGRPHPRLTMLTEPRRPVAVRLALLGGQLLLIGAKSASAIDPSAPGTPVPLPPVDLFDRTSEVVPKVQFLAPDPDAWGSVLRYGPVEGGETPLCVLRIPEATELGELAAAAKAIEAVESKGAFQISGGTALLQLRPGQWVLDTPSKDILLITGRTVEWNRDSGWQVTLLGGYPWDGLTAPPTADTEQAEVTEYDEKTGYLKVKLPGHGDLVIDAGMRADRASPDEVAVTLPRIGDKGTVIFGAGCDQALYVGATLPPGRFSKEEFGKTIRLVETAELRRHVATDGVVTESSKKADMTYREKWDVKAGAIDFNQHRGK